MVLDVSNPASPREIARPELSGSARTINVAAHHAYVGDYSGVRVFDVSDLSSIREVASYKTPASVGAVWLAEDAAYVAAYEAGLMILALETRAE